MHRRTFLQAAGLIGAANAAPFAWAGSRAENEILGQGAFRYRANRQWGRLDPAQHPVNDCHGVVEDKAGRLIVLTNDVRSNFLAYSPQGKLLGAWPSTYSTAHGLELSTIAGQERLWVTDHDLQLVAQCTLDGRELKRLDASSLAQRYSNLKSYKPTNVAVMPDGDFFISDGYGVSQIHHFDPDWKYIASFGGLGSAPENLRQPHAVWFDSRPGKPPVLVCDRLNEALKWFSVDGKLERVVSVPGALPSNAARFGEHLVIASLNGMVLIFDRDDRLISAVGGEAPSYTGDTLQKIRPFNYALMHPHDVHVDARGDLYVVQWNSNRTYPMKLERV